jgi:hypothetical protein
MRDTLPEWADELIDAGDELPPALAERIAAMGDAARPTLLDVLERRPLWRKVARGGGRAPVHAVRLLARLAPTDESISALLRALGELGVRDLLADAVGRALAGWGPAIMPAALDAHRREPDARRREMLLDVLSKCGGRSEEVFEALLAELRAGNDVAPALLAEYGDPRALSDLHVAFGAAKLDSRPSALGSHAFFELKDAVKTLGGELTPLEAAMVEAARAMNDAALLLAVAEAQAARHPTRRAGRVGPNEPCPCGGGRKFKKCCGAAGAQAPATPRFVVPTIDPTW